MPALNLVDPMFIPSIRTNVTNMYDVRATDLVTQSEFGGLDKLFKKQRATFNLSNITPENMTFRVEWRNIPNPTKSAPKGEILKIGSGGMLTMSKKDITLDAPVIYTMSGIPKLMLERNGIDAPAIIADNLYVGLVSAVSDMATKFYTRLFAAIGSSMGVIDGITYDTATKTHIVAPAMWENKAILISRLRQFIKNNNVFDATIIGGQNFVMNSDVANINSGNSNGSGENKAFSLIDIVDGGNPLQRVDNNPDSIYIVGSGSYAIFAQNYYTQPDVKKGNGFEYNIARVPSKAISGVGFDMAYAFEREADANGHVTESFNSNLSNFFDVFFREKEMSFGFNSAFRFVKG